jgi:DNA-binding transcriptional LysR family regulator
MHRERLAVAVGPNSALANKADLSVRELADQDFIIPALEGSSALYGLWFDLCRAAGFTPHVVAHIVSVQVLTELVAHDVGVAFVGANTWANGNPNVVVKQLRDVDEYLDTFIAFRPRALTEASTNFLELALRESPVSDDPTHRPAHPAVRAAG